MLHLRVVLLEEREESLRVRAGVIRCEVGGLRRRPAGERRLRRVVRRKLGCEVSGCSRGLGWLRRAETLNDADVRVFRGWRGFIRSELAEVDFLDDVLA